LGVAILLWESTKYSYWFRYLLIILFVIQRSENTYLLRIYCYLSRLIFRHLPKFQDRKIIFVPFDIVEMLFIGSPSRRTSRKCLFDVICWWFDVNFWCTLALYLNTLCIQYGGIECSDGRIVLIFFVRN
jgi:hypothetical protein